MALVGSCYKEPVAVTTYDFVSGGAVVGDLALTDEGSRLRELHQTRTDT